MGIDLDFIESEPKKDLLQFELSTEGVATIVRLEFELVTVCDFSLGLVWLKQVSCDRLLCFRSIFIGQVGYS